MGTTENKFSSVIETVNNVPEEEIKNSRDIKFKILLNLICKYKVFLF